MARLGAFASGFTSGFNLVDSAFARRAQRDRQARVDEENQRRFDIQNTRAEAVEGRLSTQFEQQQAVLAQEQAAQGLAQAYASGDMDAVLNNPAVIEQVRRRVEDGTGTTFAGIQANDDGTFTPLVNGEYPDGTPFQSMPVTHGGIPSAAAGEPIGISAEELVDMGLSGLPQSQFGQAAIAGMTAERMRGGQQDPALAQAGQGQQPAIQPPQEPLQAAEPTGPEGNLVQQAAINPPGEQQPQNFVSTLEPNQTFSLADGSTSPGLPERYVAPINDAAQRHNLPAAGLAHQMAQESRFDPRAKSGAGAEGLMQIMPATAGDLGVTDRMNATQSINGGAAYMEQMINKYEDWALALAAYNWGPGNVDKALREHGAAWLDNAPEETQEYVALLEPSYIAAEDAQATAASTQLATADAGQAAQIASQNAPAQDNRSLIQRELDDYRATVGPMPATQAIKDNPLSTTPELAGRAVGENLRGMYNIIAGTAEGAVEAGMEGLVKPVARFGKAVGKGILDSADAAKQGTAEFAAGVVDGVAAGDPNYIPTYLKASGSNEAQNARGDMATHSIQGNSAPVGTAAAEQIHQDTLNTPVTGSPTDAKGAASWQMFNRQINSGRRNVPRPVYGLMPQMVQLGIFTEEDLSEFYRTGTMTDPRTRAIVDGLNNTKAGETFYYTDGNEIRGVTKPGGLTVKSLRDAEKYRQEIRDRNEDILKRSFMAYYPGEDSEERAEALMNKLAVDMINSERFSWEQLNQYDEEQLIRFGQNYLHADNAARAAANPGLWGTLGRLLNSSAGPLVNLPDRHEDPTFYGPDGLWMIHEDVVTGDVSGVPAQPTQIEGGIMEEARKITPQEIPGLRDQLINSGDPQLAQIGRTGADHEIAVQWAAWQMGARKRSLPAQSGRR